MEHIAVKQLTTLEELYEMQKVEEAVWDKEIIPVHQTYTVLNNGGIILGAFDGKKMIAFLYSFPGFDGKKAYVCSHMLGILPKYRKGGIGEKMKLKQAEIARENGFDTITWTFDPLESVNAYLNLHKLRAKGAVFKPNYYGTLNDEFSSGLPSDRIHIIWDLKSNQERREFTFKEENVLLKKGEDGFPILADSFSMKELDAGHVWYVAIPAYFQQMKQENFERAKAWRFKTQYVFKDLFEIGYEAIDMIRDVENEVSYYVFAK